MKITKSIFLLLFIAAVGLIGGYFITGLVVNGAAEKPTKVEKVSPSSTQMRPDAEGQENSLTRTQSEGAVAVKATLLPKKSGTNQLVFEIIMNTHSVDLQQYDLSKITEVSFGNEPITQGFEWAPSSNDSHHMMGTLTWTGELVDGFEDVSLNIKGIDNIPSRLFTWQKGELKGIGVN